MTDQDTPMSALSSANQMEPKDLFKFVLDTRNFEITNFWQRSNHFLVLNTGIAIGFFNLKDQAYALVLSLLVNAPRSTFLSS